MEILKTARKLGPLHRDLLAALASRRILASERKRNLACTPYLFCPCKFMPCFLSWGYVNAFPHGHLSRLSTVINIRQTSLVYKGEGKMLQIGIVIPMEGIFRGGCFWHRIRAFLQLKVWFNLRTMKTWKRSHIALTQILDAADLLRLQGKEVYCAWLST